MDQTANQPLPPPAVPAASPDPTDRLLAALAHGSAILLGWGAAIPAVIWAARGKRSGFLTFQALQALAYQILLSVYMFVVSTSSSLVFLVLVVILMMNKPDDVGLVFLFEIMLFLVIFAAVTLYVLLGLAAGVIVFVGQDFQYPLLGSWIKKYLARQTEVGR